MKAFEVHVGRFLAAPVALEAPHAQAAFWVCMVVCLVVLLFPVAQPSVPVHAKNVCSMCVKTNMCTPHGNGV